jgi:glutaredoxin
MKRIYIFTWPKCKGCETLKQTLIDQSIPFIEVNALDPKNKKLWDSIKAQTNSEAVPLAFIQEENNVEGIAYVPNEDWKTIDEIAKIIKDNI